MEFENEVVLSGNTIVKSKYKQYISIMAGTKDVGSTNFRKPCKLYRPLFDTSIDECMGVLADAFEEYVRKSKI